MALAEVGCIVDVVCPSSHPIQLTHSVRRIHRYNGLLPISSFERAIREVRPDLVVPGDDLATWHLHELHRRELRKNPTGSEICDLVERSLGSAANFGVIAARNTFMQVAKEEGIRVPQSAVVGNLSDLHEWVARIGFPIVLKANGTSGGDGVRVVLTVEESERDFRKLQSPPLLARAVKRAVIDRDLTLLWPSLCRRRPVVSAQTFVAGREATSALFCWKGNVLASLHFEVIQKTGATGHATVVRQIDHEEMSSAPEKIARRLNLSGFHGLDYMIEDQTGNAYLIEINPRTTQVGHLALGEGRNLPAALWQVLTGKRHVSKSSITSRDTIALFPQEWKRDPASLFLVQAYHDVPWREPALVNSCAAKVRVLGNPKVTVMRSNSNETRSAAMAGATPSVGD
ncbi:MAG TPA: ATP-grasp domain-containing protein [Candidatus Sulfotelmatobacter sp.]|nr:ATP-grasp domain-containing protein [Candidatus Sulfotelmatobacter sp.]